MNEPGTWDSQANARASRPRSRSDLAPGRFPAWGCRKTRCLIQAFPTSKKLGLGADSLGLVHPDPVSPLVLLLYNDVAGFPRNQLPTFEVRRRIP